MTAAVACRVCGIVALVSVGLGQLPGDAARASDPLFAAPALPTSIAPTPLPAVDEQAGAAPAAAAANVPTAVGAPPPSFQSASSIGSTFEGSPATSIQLVAQETLLQPGDPTGAASAALLDDAETALRAATGTAQGQASDAAVPTAQAPLPSMPAPVASDLAESCGCGPGQPGCCSAGAGCHENPDASFPARVHGDLLELLAVDAARRALLAIHPYAADEPILTLEVKIRPQGHVVHTYAKLQWHRRHWWQSAEAAKTYESEVSTTLLYHPDKRQMYDISYVDNAYFPWRNNDMAIQVVASYNEDFALRDAMGLPPKFLSDRVDVLEPYIKPRWANYGPVREPDPRARSLRTVRRDSNVTSNQ